MSDAKITNVMVECMLDTFCPNWRKNSQGAQDSDRHMGYLALKAALDAHATPSPLPAERMRMRIAVAFDGNDQPYIHKVDGGDVESAWNELEDWYSAIHRPAIISATIPLPKVAEIEGTVETEAG